MRKAQQRRKQSGAMEKEKTGMLSNAVLKNIAYITMFIDHFFAVVYYTLVRQLQTAGYVVGNEERIYAAGRAVGRIAFILFAYLAVEGFQHTKSRKAYLLRLGIFAFVSEIPFDLAFSEVCFNKESQNVFFTLLIGVLVLTVFAWAEQKADGLRMSVDSRGRGTITSVAGVVLDVAAIAAVLLGCLAACELRTDYQFMGVLLIFAFYRTRERSLPVQVAAAGCVMLFGTWGANCLKYGDSYTLSYLFRFSMREMYGLFAFIPIVLYNGRKGRQLPKAVCYGFYPVHLLLLHFVAQMISGRV